MPGTGVPAADRGRGPRTAARALPATIALAVALLACSSATPAADAAEAPGSISGTVTAAATASPLSGVEVCATPPAPAVTNEEEPSEPEPACAATSSAGEYSIPSLAPGSYTIVFNPALVPSPSSPLGVAFTTVDYVSQAWQDASKSSAAKAVPVTPGEHVSGINAALAQGGEVSGEITAAGGGPLANALACAGSFSEEEAAFGHFGCAITGAGGEYAIYGLAPGSYDVLFAAAGYSPQVYNGQSQAESATSVSVVAGGVAAGIDASLAVRAKLPPQAAPGEGGSAPGPGALGQPTQGSSAGTVLSLRSSKLAVLHGRVVDVVLTCHGSIRCHGRVNLSVHGSGKRRGSRSRLLGAARFNIAPGAREVVALRLDGFGRALLATDHGRLAARLAVILMGSASGSPQLLSVRLRPSPHRS